MLKFSLYEGTKDLFGQDHRAVQWAITKLANAEFGIKDPKNLQLGIFCAEGGIVVNARDIVIHSNFVEDYRGNGRHETAEEIAVVCAIYDVENFIKYHNIDAVRGLFGNPIPTFAEPLRKLVL